MKTPLTHERAFGLLDYDEETGVFHWKVRRGNVRAGTEAGGDHGTGYKVIGIDGRLYLAHRLAWFMSHGVWPKDQIDHINGVKDDNRLSNLREATTAENHQNMPIRRDNTSGHSGVYWRSDTNLWQAQICAHGKRRTLGQFPTKDEAAKAYAAAKRAAHSFHPHVSEGLRAVAVHLREIDSG